MSGQIAESIIIKVGHGIMKIPRNIQKLESHKIPLIKKMTKKMLEEKTEKA